MLKNIKLEFDYFANTSMVDDTKGPKCEGGFGIIWICQIVCNKPIQLENI